MCLWHRRRWLALWWWLLGYGAYPSGAGATCTGPVVRVDGRLPAAWQEAERALPARIAEFPGLDPCSTVRLFERSGVVFAQAELADGRTTRRRVDQPEELVAVTAALLTELPEDEPPRLPAPPTSSAPAQKASKDALLSPDRSAPESNVPLHVALEVGLAASLRLAGPPRYAGVGLTALFGASLDAWLLGVWVRWDIRDYAFDQKNLPSDLDMASVLLGAYMGYRLRLGPAALDFMIGPNVLFENQEARNSAGPGEVGGIFTDLSISALVRLTAPVTDPLRFFMLLGGEIYPLRAADRVERNPILPELPAYAGTLALGAAWSSL